MRQALATLALWAILLAWGAGVGLGQSTGRPAVAPSAAPSAPPVARAKPSPTPLSEAAERDLRYGEAIKEAKKLSKNNDLAGARAAYERAAAIRIDRADPWLEIAYLYTKEKDAPNADKAALRGVEVDSESNCYDFVIQASRRYVTARDFESAVRVLEPLHRLRPDDLDVTDRLFVSYNNRQQYTDCLREGREAAERFVKFCAEHPTAPVAPRQFLDLFATASVESGEVDATVQWARETFASPAPRSPGALVLAALLRQQAGEVCLRQTPAAGAAVLASALDLAPDDASSLMPQATRIESEKGIDVAEAFLDACAARLPERISIRDDQAHFYFQAGAFDKAEVLYRALDTDPKPLNTNEGQLLQCLVQEVKLDALDQETARIAKAVTEAGKDGGSQPKIAGDERKRLMDQLADYHIRAAKELQKRNATAAQPGPAPSPTEAVAYLGSCRERFPQSLEIPRTMGNLLQGDKRYEAAAAIFGELMATDGQNAATVEPLLDCLMALRRYNDALPILQDRIRQVESDASQPAKQRSDRVSKLETRYAEILNGSDVMREKIRTASNCVAAAPTSATLHSQLAQLFYGAGQGELALSEFLQAAVLSDKGDELVDTALRVARERKTPLSLAYLKAVIDHFPTHARIFEVIEESVRARSARDQRFAFGAEDVAALEDASQDCLRVAANPGSTPERRVEARMKALLYHLEPLPTEPEIWTEARKELAAFLDDPDLTARLRKSVLEALADMDTKRLANPRSAYAIVEDLARQNPTPESLQRVADAASKLIPRPDPAVLLEYVNKNVMPSLNDALLTRAEVKNEEPSLRMLAMLAAWLWEMGRREEAVGLLRPGTEHLADGRPVTRALAKRLLAQVRRANPDLAASIEAPKPDRALAGTVRLTRTFVCESGADDLSRAVMYEDTRLEVPRDVFPRQTLTVRAAERPASAEPPVFFQAAGDTSRTWGAVWRPAETTEWRADATDAFVLTSPMVERRQDTVALRRNLGEDPEKAGVLRLDVAVRAAQSCEIVIKYGGRFFAAPPIEVQPEGGAVDKAAKTVTFKNLAPALLAAGTTLTLRFQMPEDASGARWRDAPLPSVELTVTDVARDETLRKAAAGQWGIETPDGALRYGIGAAEDVAGDVPARVAMRHQYRLAWFGRP